MIQIAIWVFCVLLVLAILGVFVVSRFVVFLIEQLLGFIQNYKRYKDFYYKHFNDRFSKYLEEQNEKAKTQKEREEK